MLTCNGGGRFLSLAKVNMSLLKDFGIEWYGSRPSITASEMNELIKVYDGISGDAQKENVDRVIETLTNLAGPPLNKFIPKNKLKKFADNIVSIRQSIDNENNNKILAKLKIKRFERKIQRIEDEGGKLATSSWKRRISKMLKKITRPQKLG